MWTDRAPLLAHTRLIRSGDGQLTSPNSSPGRIVRWEVLKGLPGEGPIPKHFHCGHPTPWAEGFVVRFWNENGADWVGNFQGQWGVDAVFDVPESAILFVIAYGACYFVSKSDPGQFVCHRHGVTAALVHEERLLILAYQGGDLAAYERDGKQVWLRENIAVDEIELKSCADGVITADIECDYDGSWRTIKIKAADGTDVGAGT